MPKRRRVEILAAVLSSAVRGARKTRIMYDANLSYSIFTKYLEETIGLGFLQFGNGSYQTTTMGLKFLESYNRFSSKYSRLRKELEASEMDWKILEQMCDPAINNCGSKTNDVLPNPFQPLSRYQKCALKQSMR
jgi:predicted transcriptional regulator